jgi:hypothetical protein
MNSNYTNKSTENLIKLLNRTSNEILSYEEFTKLHDKQKKKKIVPIKDIFKKTRKRPTNSVININSSKE